MRVGFALCVMVAVLSTACGEKIVVNGIEVYEKQWTRAVEDIRPRASFEIGCGPEQLTFGLLKRTGRVPTEVIATGCGRRALYVRPVASGGYGGRTIVGSWILSTMSADAAAPTAQTSVPIGVVPPQSTP